MLQVDIDANSPAAIAPMARHGQLEVDCFCSGCHYNLHGQEVWIDERLQIPICRCPECGRHHPAGSGVTAHSVWLRRFASLLLALWVIVVLFLAFLACLGFGGMQSAYIDAFTSWQAPQKSGPGIMQAMIQPPDSGQDDLSHWISWAMICFASAGIGFLFATFVVTAMWHWPRRRYFFAVALPLISSGFVIAIYCTDTAYQNIRPWCIERAFTQAAVQMGGIVLGILFGRKLGRTLVRMVVPAKPRQLLVFLWRADGLEMPGDGKVKADKAAGV